MPVYYSSVRLTYIMGFVTAGTEGRRLEAASTAGFVWRELRARDETTDGKMAAEYVTTVLCNCEQRCITVSAVLCNCVQRCITVSAVLCNCVQK